MNGELYVLAAFSLSIEPQFPLTTGLGGVVPELFWTLCKIHELVSPADSRLAIVRSSIPYNLVTVLTESTHLHFPHSWSPHFFLSPMALPPNASRASSFLMRFLDHTQRRTTFGRTPLDEWSARRRDLYLTTHNTHNRQTSMPPEGFEPAIPASERSQTYALDRAATGTGCGPPLSSSSMLPPEWEKPFTITILWIATSCYLVDGYGRFGESWCFVFKIIGPWL